ncbi:MAG: nicotinate phosphoribosyltransferase [Elusimicrobia bacterium]|nr:nicotinate phosphoribosyltransferase [Elusimicrobiota bacterium]
MLTGLYGGSLALLTDLYQLTMAQGYWKSGLERHEAVFHLYFRKNPYAGSYALAAGLGLAAEYLERLRFTEDDLAYLASLPGDGRPLFDPGFLERLRGLRLTVDLDGVPEGTAVFAPEPLLRVRGGLLECQLLETALLNIVNFQTLIATKAARVASAARGAPVLEFGLRRAQGIDGGVGASRAAYIGGCSATSNVLAGKLLGIPVRGTHAHSWVMAFSDELEAFSTYAESVPGDCVFLVDTYDTLEGVRHAIAVGRRLKEQGRRLAGIRLDSGDLAALSIEARRLLDGAGFPDAFIAASDDLDEGRIAALLQKGARIAVWGVGTRLVTGDGQGALGGVYKLSAIRPPGGAWRDVVKASGDGAKASFPGLLQVRRSFCEGRPAGDEIFDVRDLPEEAEHGLLVPVFRGGRRVLPDESLAAARERARTGLAALPSGRYPVALAAGLRERRAALLSAAAGAFGGRDGFSRLSV